MPEFTPDISLESIRQDVQKFAADRNWQQFHSTRNLLLAVLSEMGELADIVRWLGDKDHNEHGIPDDKKQDWADEMADVFILLIRLADRSGVDLVSAYQRKLKIAGEKYPIEEFYGSNKKYNDS